LIGGVTKRLPQLINGSVYAVFKVAGTDTGPKKAAKVFTGHQLTRPFHQRSQNLPRLSGKFDSVAMLAQFRNDGVEFKWSKGEVRRPRGLRKP
jgi:hypothetical protein